MFPNRSRILLGVAIAIGVVSTSVGAGYIMASVGRSQPKSVAELAIPAATVHHSTLVVGDTTTSIAPVTTTTSPPASTTTLPPTYSLWGTMDVYHDVGGPAGKACDGSGAYADITSGAPVKITNEKGAAIGTGTLGAGKAVAADSTGQIYWCEFAFKTITVSKASSYGVGVGQRSAVKFSYDDLVKSGWKAELTLGDGT